MFWHIEDIIADKHRTAKGLENECESFYKQNATRGAGDSYVVRHSYKRIWILQAPEM